MDLGGQQRKARKLKSLRCSTPSDMTYLEPQPIISLLASCAIPHSRRWGMRMRMSWRGNSVHISTRVKLDSFTNLEQPNKLSTRLAITIAMLRALDVAFNMCTCTCTCTCMCAPLLYAARSNNIALAEKLTCDSHRIKALPLPGAAWRSFSIRTAKNFCLRFCFCGRTASSLESSSSRVGY